MRGGMRVQDAVDDGCEAGNILVVFDDRHPLAMLVRPNALEPFEHLEPLDRDPAVIAVHVGPERAGYRMRMEHRSGTACPDDLDVQQRFSGRARDPGSDRFAPFVHFEDLIHRQLALECRARRDREPQRMTVDDDAEVAACAKHPAALVEAPADPHELLGDRAECGQVLHDDEVDYKSSASPVAPLNGSRTALFLSSRPWRSRNSAIPALTWDSILAVHARCG